MLLRIRWFVLGLATAIGGGAWVISKAVRMRERLSPAGLRRAGALVTADVFSAASRAVQPVSRERAPH